MPTRSEWIARLLVGAATCSTLYWTSFAGAQEASPASRESSTQPSQVSEVIVTAQKRAESLLKVPAPVTALQATALARQGAVQLADYAANVPGLNLISSQPGQTVVIMRGITTGFGAAIPATTSTYIDDVPYGSSTASAYGSIATLDLDPGSLQRVEVLRGPQGTLYGASALGGVIRYVTTSPSLTQYSGRVEVDGSTIDGGGSGGGVRVMVGGPLIEDKLGFTISAFDRLDPGFINDPRRNVNNINDSRVDGGRLAVLWRPTAQLSVRASALTQDTYTNSTSEVDVDSNLNPLYGKYRQNRSGNEYWRFRAAQYSLSANYDLGWANLTSITSYSTRSARWDIDFTRKFGPLLSGILGVPDLAPFDNITLQNEKTTQEIRLASPDNNKFEWLGGFFFTHEHSIKPEAFLNPFSTVTGAVTSVPQGIFADTLNDSFTEYAGYADATYYFTPQLKILVGLRYAQDSEKNVTPFSGILYGPSEVAVGTSSDSSLTYLLSPSYNINQDNMIYIRIASGFRPGGPTGVSSSNLLSGVPESYAPDTLTNYEVGYKASFPAQHMTLDASGYDIEWSRIQLIVINGGFNYPGNGGSARSAGGELAWTWRPITGLNLSGNAAYTHAYLTADAPGLGGKSGQDLPEVPRFAGNLAADYDFPITGGISGFVGGNAQYLGRRHIDFIAGAPASFTPQVMPDFTTVNLRAGVNRGGLTAEFYIRNVGDAWGLTRVVSEVRNGYGAPLGASVVQPRTFGVSISNKF